MIQLYKQWMSGVKDPESAENAHGHISTWDVSNVTDMSKLFSYNECSTFNEDISNWGCFKCYQYE